MAFLGGNPVSKLRNGVEVSTGKRDGQKDIARLSQSFYTMKRPPYINTTGSSSSPVQERASGAVGTGWKAEESFPEGAETSKRWMNLLLNHLSFVLPVYVKKSPTRKRANSPKEGGPKGHSDAMPNGCQRRHKMQLVAQEMESSIHGKRMALDC